MASVFSTFLRGVVGVAAAILIVAITWTVYIKRDAVIGASEPVVRLLSEATARESDTPAGSAAPAQPADTDGTSGAATTTGAADAAPEKQ